MTWRAWYETLNGVVLFEATANDKYKAISKLGAMLPEDVEPGVVKIGGDTVVTSGGAGTDNI